MKRSTTVAAALATLFSATQARAVDNLGLFELEQNANAVDNSGAPLPDDWQTLYLDNTPPAGGSDDFTGILADPSSATPNNPDLRNDATVFTQGGSKDDHPVGDWHHKAGTIPDKNDITNAYAASYTCPLGNHLADGDDCEEGDLIVYFGADRLANKGDAFLGFWFFQQDVGPVAGGTFSNEHTVGDILVLVQYPQGTNANPIIRVLVWDPDATIPGAVAVKGADNLRELFSGTARCNGGTDTDFVCAVTNSTVQTAPWPYVSKTNTTNFPPESFYEGGINITQLLGSTPCFNDFLAESRSSESVDAILKDFVHGDFELCSGEVTKDCGPNPTLLADGSLSATFFGFVSNTGKGDLDVELADQSSTHVITAVCFDAANDGCDAGDAVPDNLDEDPGTDNLASFTLHKGETVRYEGTMVDPNPTFDSDTGEFVTTDTVDVTLFDSNTGTEVATASDDAECRVPGVPGITVDKRCTADISGGDTLLVLVEGEGKNTGQVPLNPVKLTDTDLNGASGTLSACLDADCDGVCDGGTLCSNYTQCSTTGFMLDPGECFEFEGQYTQTGGTAATDTITATGTPAFGGADVTDTGVANCGGTATPGVTIDKTCDVGLSSDFTSVVFTVTVTVTNTGNVDLTNVSVTDTDFTLDGFSTTFDVGHSETRTYHPTIPSNPTQCLSDTATVNATGALGSGDVSDSDDANCSLCPGDCGPP